MRQLLQKARDAMVQRRSSRQDELRHQTAQPETKTSGLVDWGMSPEDALKVGTVARYK